MKLLISEFIYLFSGQGYNCIIRKVLNVWSKTNNYRVAVGGRLAPLDFRKFTLV